MNTAELIGLLGVGDDPTTGEVRAARRSVAKRLHPDLAGERRTRAMAEINAGCDRLIAAIRAGRKLTLSASPQAARSTPRQTGVRIRVAPDFQPAYAAVTLVVMLFVFVVCAFAIGTGAAGLAIALLMSAIAGGVSVALLLRLLDR